jgi:O-methyltransferase
MVTSKNLIALYKLVQTANELGLPGDIVECGVWNGGSAGVMGWATSRYTHNRMNRNIWLFDSFQGLPRPTEKDGKREKENYFEGWCKGDVTKVKRILTRLNVPVELIKIVPGWFADTLRTAPLDRIAILHIDADWYESVKLVLDVFYDKVVPGGFIVLNDYGMWPGCDQAVSDYFVEHNLHNIEITIVEPCNGAYFQKPDL